MVCGKFCKIYLQMITFLYKPMRTGTVYLDGDLFMNYHFFCYTYWSNNRADIFRVGEILIKYS